MSELKCVVMGGKVFNVEVIGPNPSIKDGFYVRYDDGSTDTFRSKCLIDRQDSFVTTNEVKREAIAELLALHEQDRAKVNSQCDTLINMSTVRKYLDGLE